MTKSYLRRLLREAQRYPQELPKQRRFWKLEFWRRYLRCCDDVLFDKPRAGLALTIPAPELAARLQEAIPSANAYDLRLLGNAYLAGAYRRNDDYTRAETLFERAAEFRTGATPEARAEFLRRFAYLRICQSDPGCFPLIDRAIQIRKRGNLVYRHHLGECLICRGHAYLAFDRPGETLDDWTSALSHISLVEDRKTYYAALHNLVLITISHGRKEDLPTAYENLRHVPRTLHTCHAPLLAKTRVRWLLAMLETRLEIYGCAEENFLKARAGLVELGLAYELGMLCTDLALLYLKQGRTQMLEDLVRRTAAFYRSMGAEANARRALNILRRAPRVDVTLLAQLRGKFESHSEPAPVVAA